MRILWLKTEFLHPVDKGGRIRTYHMLRAIAAQHEVTYLTLDDGTAARNAAELAREYSHRVRVIPFTPPTKGSAAFFGALARNVFSPLPYAVARYRSAAMEQTIAEEAPRHDLVVCDFLTPAVNMAFPLDTPTVLFQHNVEAMIWQRHAEVPQSAVRRRYMLEQWRRMRRFEGDMCRQFDGVVAVSEQDATALERDYGLRGVTAVPTGVDVDYFHPTSPADRRPYELVFTGSMDWMPNDDAMIWFIEDILPRIRTAVPQVTVTVVGRTPGTRLREVAAQASGVEVTGRVEDVRPYLQRAAAFIVPMRIGGGTRLKIYEAMATGLPVVSTTVGAEGLPLVSGRHVELRDTAGEFADAVTSLLQDSVRRERLAQTGADEVRARFAWSGVAAEFMAQCAAVRTTTL